MKVGLLTLPFNNNYGGYLQAASLIKVVNDLGHECELIYRRPNKRSLKKRIEYLIKSIIKTLLFMKDGPIIPNQEKELRARGINMMSFVDNNIVPRTKPLYSSRELKKYFLNNQYNAVIVGSDQVWRPDYVPSISDFFLSFIEDNKSIKKIAYAASFGLENPNYSCNQIQICGDLITKFDAISLREKSGVEIISKFGWNVKSNPIVTLDPTMLNGIEYYNSFLNKSVSDSMGKIFCYILDFNERIDRLTNQISQMFGKDLFYIINTKKWKHFSYKMPSIESWLINLRDSDFVITDSFHGTVFSILFNKPFVVFANPDRGIDRFKTLLSRFNLSNRLLSEKETDLTVIVEPIQWDKINDILETERLLSLLFLENALTVE